MNNASVSASRGLVPTDDNGPRWMALPLPLLLAAWALLWLLVLGLTAESPPADNVEQLTWVRSLQWGYYKHPPLPTALLWPLVQLFGVYPVLTYGLGGALTCLSLWLTWRLVRTTSGPHMALVALLAAMCVTFYNGRLYYYNHNTVMMVFVTWAALVSWRLFRAPSLGGWATLGLAVGLGALAKYQIVLVALPVAGLWLSQRAWRKSVHRRGPWLALLVAAAVVAPHAWWFWTHDALPLQYARQTSLGTGQHGVAAWAQSTHWLVDQLLNRALPAWLVLGFLAWRAARRARAGAPPPPVAPAAALESGRTGPTPALFWALWGIPPLLVMWLMGMFAGVSPQLHWGTAFLALTVAAAVHLAPAERWHRLRRTEVAKAFLVVQALLLAWSCVGPLAVRAGLRPAHVAQFPSDMLAQAAAAQARPLLGGTIRYVAGPAFIASEISTSLEERPLVILEGRFEYSPWVDPAQARRDGVLWLGIEGRETPPAGLKAQPLGHGLWWAVQPGQGAAAPATGQ